VYAYRLPKRTELVIVDKADRLKMAGLVGNQPDADRDQKGKPM
jgi:hypothetical protein